MPEKIVVLAEFVVPPKYLDTFLDVCAADSASSLRDEPGCLQFDVLTDPEEPDHVVLHEVYADQAAFDAHRTTPHYAAFTEGEARCGAERHRVRLLSHRHP